MSDLTTLSHEYATQSGFARAINDSVLALKRARDAEGYREKTKLLTELNKIVGYLVNRVTGEFPAGEKPVPEDVVRRLMQRHSGSLEHLREDLTHLLEGLASADLTLKDWETLDELCDIADRATSASFRRLRRR